MSNVARSVMVVTNNTSFLKETVSHFKNFFCPSTPFKNCTFNEALSQPKEQNPFLVLIDLTEPEEFVFSQAKRIAAHFENAKVVCIGHPSDVAVVLEFIKVGVKDFLKLPLNEEEIKKLCERSLDPPEFLTVNTKIKKAKVITLYSPKGGTGLTFLTVNLGVALAKGGQNKVTVCDFSPQCGDAATYLNLAPQYSVRDIIDNNPALDTSFLDGVLLKHPTGVRILAATTQQEQDTLTFEHLNTVESILKILKTSNAFILIDGGHLDPSLLQYVMLESDMIFLVGNPDVVSLKGLVASFNALKTQGIDTEKIKIIINRYNSKSQIDTKEFEKKTKHPITAQLPNNYMLCIEAVNTGQPLSHIQEKSDLSKKINEMAEMILKLCVLEGASKAEFDINLAVRPRNLFSILQKKGR